MVGPGLVKRDPTLPLVQRDQRLAMTPTVAARAFSHSYDVSNTLPLVQAPTLVLHPQQYPPAIAP